MPLRPRANSPNPDTLISGALPYQGDMNNASPLIVDLDGTLVHTDLLHETLIGALKEKLCLCFCIPFWLLSTLSKRYNEFRRLIVIFHELYAFGPPWRSSFWLSPLQKYIVIGILKISSEWITSCRSYKLKLESYMPSKVGHLLPIFSTIGEPMQKKPKEKIISIFGLPSSRIKV
jgi:hypothetical protein